MLGRLLKTLIKQHVHVEQVRSVLQLPSRPAQPSIHLWVLPLFSLIFFFQLVTRKTMCHQHSILTQACVANVGAASVACTVTKILYCCHTDKFGVIFNK